MSEVSISKRGKINAILNSLCEKDGLSLNLFLMSMVKMVIKLIKIAIMA